MFSRNWKKKVEVGRLAQIPLVLMALSLVFGSGCTKELPYKKRLKEDVIAKSLISDEEYLYLPSLQNVSRSSEATLPYWMGQVKRVKFELTKEALLAYEVEDDSRFSKNEANRKLVMSFPIENVEYRCREDRFGECQNEEEENEDITWDKRTKFKFKVQDLKVIEASFLPIELAALSGQNCYNEKSTKLLDYSITETDINIRVEKSFDVSLSCINSQIERLSDTTATVVYHYSFAKKSSIVSKDYEAVPYPEQDQSTFGFFATERNIKDVDNSERQEDRQSFLHRWNPKKKTVTYHLSPEFKLKENQKLRKSTELAVQRVNEGLREAGADFSIVLEDAPQGLHSGNLRASMIVLVADPSKAGPAGYGPTAVNPETGEILSARIVMFPGLMKQYIRLTYEDIYEEKKTEEKKKKKMKKVSEEDTPKQKPSTMASLSTNQAPAFASDQSFAQPHRIQEMKNFLEHSGKRFLANTKDDILGSMAKHNIYPIELVNFNAALKKGLGQALGGELRPWDALSKEERQRVIDLVLPETWTSTMVHEIGHTLGLRHNFKGSVDKDNFYSHQELQKMGIDHEIPYSSTMDYAFTDLNDLPTLGRYDIAALRFAYTREVAMKSGDSFKFVKLKGSLEELAGQTLGSTTGSSAAGYAERAGWLRENLKPYAYCTDEHVSVNADCNRFDEGSSRTEIVEHMINNNYHGYYSIRNRRAGRAHFSSFDDAGYVARIRSVFTEMRLNFENYESLKSRFKLSDSDPAWEQVEWLKDLKKATLLSARFFMDVLMTPDLTCVVARTEAPDTAIGALTLASLNPDAQSCQEIQWNPGYMTLGQAGKSFNSAKDKNNPSPYIDQIDVRGVAYDKILALEALLNRRTGISIFDESLDNYLDIEPLHSEVQRTLQNLLLDAAGGPLRYTDGEGQVRTMNTSYQLGGHVAIPEALNSQVTKALDLPPGQVHLGDQLIHVIHREMTQSSKHLRSGQKVIDHFAVTKLSVHDPIQITHPDGSPIAGLSYYDFGQVRYLALSQNVLASEFILILTTLDVLARIGQERALEIVNLRLQGQELPAELTREEQHFAKLPLELARSAVEGAFSSADHYLDLLEVMAK